VPARAPRPGARPPARARRGLHALRRASAALPPQDWRAGLVWSGLQRQCTQTRCVPWILLSAVQSGAVARPSFQATGWPTQRPELFRRTRRGRGARTPSARPRSAQVLTNAEFLARKRAGAILPGPFGGWTDTAARPPAREGAAGAAAPGAGPSAGAAGAHDEGVLARAAKRLKRRREDGAPGESGGPRQWCSVM
jgi:hypothetical protein